MIYFISINILGYFLCGLDKWLAKKRKYRLPENFLLLIVFLGGCLGFLIGMYFFHHKTKKLKFKLVYVSLFLWLFLWYTFYFS